MLPRLLPLAAVAILLSGGGAPSAYAGYIVTTDAQTAFSNFYTAVGDYNILATGSTFTTFSGNVALVSSGGTIDLTGLLPQSFDQASISYNSTGLPGGLQTGSAYAAADLVNGTLKAGNVNVSTGNISSDSTATFSDVLHYTIQGATDSTITDIPVQFALDGSASGLTGALGSVQWQMVFGSAGMTTFISLDPSICASNPCISGQNDAGWVPGSATFASNTVGNIIFEGLYQIQGATADIPVSGSLFIGNGGGASSTLDYSHTAQFLLPQTSGVSFTSDSGVFLTGSGPAPVPEPASIVLLGLGMVAIGLARRRLHR